MHQLKKNPDPSIEKSIYKEDDLNGNNDKNNDKIILNPQEIRTLLINTDFKTIPENEERFIPLFQQVWQNLQAVAGLGNECTVWADSLSIWIQRASQSITYNSKFKSIIISKITQEQFSNILYFVLDFWADSNAPIGNALKELLVKTLNFIHILYSLEEFKNIINPWIIHVLSLPKTRRVVYLVLEIIPKYSSIQFILQNAGKNFFSDSLQLMTTSTLANPVAKALFKLLQASRLELKKTSTSQFSSSSSPLNSNSSSIDPEILWLNIWQPSIKNALLDSKLRKNVQIYLLPYLFKESTIAYKNFIESLKINILSSEDQTAALICSFKVAQDIGIDDVVPADNQSEFPISNSISHVITRELLANLLHHSSPIIRQGALSIAISSPKTSKPIPSFILNCLKESLLEFLCESDAEFRNSSYGLIRNMFTRLRASSHALLREHNKIPENESTILKKSLIKTEIDAVQEFCQWLIFQLKQFLRPGSSYQRLFSALTVLILAIRSGIDNSIHESHKEKRQMDFPFSIFIFDKTTIRLLVSNVSNQYEDVRRLSEEILCMVPTSDTNLFQLKTIDDLAKKGTEFLLGIRGREADAGARIMQLAFINYQRISSGSKNYELDFLQTLIKKLSENVSISENSLAQAIKFAPLHGYLISLKLIFSYVNINKYSSSLQKKWAQWILEIFALMHRIWIVSETMLCNDSPEGFLPDEIEDLVINQTNDQTPAAQLILSFSWRSIKECSSLAEQIMISVPDFSKDNICLITEETIKKQGELLITQLTLIRHRGAFSSVYPALVACCSRCNFSQSYPNLSVLPEEWLTLNIDTLSTLSKFVTRRSGGLPFLITAILTAKNKEDKSNQLLHMAFDRLEAIAKTTPPVPPEKIFMEDEKVELPQVHAMNCIKAIFIETKLSESSSCLVDRALLLAISSFSSEWWAIRNCAVMLYTALQNRMFGTKKYYLSRLAISTMPAKKFFSTFKSAKLILFEFLSKNVPQLRTYDNFESRRIGTVYPVLSLLSRLEVGDNYQGLDDFIPLVNSCLYSKVWKIRELAARTLSTLYSGDKFEKAIGLFKNISCEKQNVIHGKLLTIENILDLSLINENVIPVKFLQSLEKNVDILLASNSCPVTRCVYIRILKKTLNAYTANSSDTFGMELCGVLHGTLYKKWMFEIDNSHVRALVDAQKLDPARRLSFAELTEYCVTYILEGKFFSETLVHYLLQSLEDPYYEAQHNSIKIIESHIKNLGLDVANKVSKSFWKIIISDNWEQTKSLAMRAFFKLWMYIGPVSDDDILECWKILYAQVKIDNIGSFSEYSLEVLGSLAAFLKDRNLIKKWILRVVLYANENEAVTSRKAAFNSISVFIKEFQKSKLEPNDEFIETLFILFDFLTDDDDEIRQNASAFIAKEFKLEFSFTSMYTEREFYRILAESYKSLIAKHLIVRITGKEEFKSQISNALNVSKALFVVEKQNLYRNEVSVVELSYETLNTIKASKDILNTFVSWLAESITQLKVAISKLGNDGLLGWCNSPDMFLICARVVCSIKLYKNKSWIGSYSDFPNASELEKDIKDLEAIFEKEDIHPLLLNALKNGS